MIMRMSMFIAPPSSLVHVAFLNAPQRSPVSREIQANHVSVYLPSTLLCEITTRQNESLTHTHTLVFYVYVHGIDRAHVHGTYGQHMIRVFVLCHIYKLH